LRVSVCAGALCSSEKPVCYCIALCGAPGLGKTTVANLVLTHKAIAETFPRIIPVLVGQNPSIDKIFMYIWGEQDWGMLRSWNTVEEGRRILEAQMASEPRTLLVLDDVWTHEALQLLNICNGGEHKLLVTSRSRSILSRIPQKQCKVFCEELRLRDDHARHLLCMHAFHSTGTPPQEDGWERMVEAVMKKCANVPHSLQVRDS
jgi:hypothetical protein